MRPLHPLTIPGLCLAVLSCGSETRQEPPAARPSAAAAKAQSASLACEGGRFSKFRLRNTKSRSYSAGFPSNNQCDLTDKAEGVVWVATGEGLELQDADKKLTFKDGRGRELRYTCWTSSGTINGIAQTELILYGPPDSSTISVCCGASCAEAVVE